jgi:hypothetical protein
MISRERWEKKFTSRAFYKAREPRPEVKDVLEQLRTGALTAKGAINKLTKMGFSEKLARLFIDEHLPHSSTDIGGTP